MIYVEYVIWMWQLTALISMVKGHPTPDISEDTTALRSNHHISERSSGKLVFGLEEGDAKIVRELVGKIKEARAEKDGVQLPESEKNKPLIADIALTVSQAKRLYKKEVKKGRRQKRHSLDMEAYPFTRWPLPIRYRIQEGYFSKADREMIGAAFRRWEEVTCLRFLEDPEYEGNMLEIRGDDEGCWSFVGRRRDLVRQTINLKSPDCTLFTGVAMHEIGHAIGLYHMEDDPERKDYITIIKRNIIRGLEVNLEPVDEADMNRYGVPWDYASIMQFRRDSFSEDGSFTILQDDPEYFYTAGMIDDISYLDVTTVNRAYQCYDYCDSVNRFSPSTPICYNNGYPNPGVTSQCSTCLCPAGLMGDCTQPAHGSKGCTPGSSVITVTESGGCLESPGYRSGSYSLGDTCSWILRSPEGTGIKLHLDTTGGFGVYHYNVSGGVCNHYVEIKFNGNFTLPGKRVCGSEKYTYNQNEAVTSYTNEALVYFNALSPEFLDNDPKKTVGFKLCYEISPVVGKKCNRINKSTGKCKKP